MFGVFDERRLLAVRPYRAAAGDRLAEVNVDRRASRRLDPFQLSRRRNVESLRQATIANEFVKSTFLEMTNTTAAPTVAMALNGTSLYDLAVLE